MSAIYFDVPAPAHRLLKALPLKYTEAVEIYGEREIDDHVRVIIFGQPFSYEWAIQRDSKIEQHSNHGYGICDVALIDGLTAYWKPPLPAVPRCTCYVLPHTEDCGLFVGITQAGDRVLATTKENGAIRQAELIAKMNECVLNTDVAGRPNGALMDTWNALMGALSTPTNDVNAEAISIMTQRAGGELFIPNGSDIKVGTTFARVEEGGVRFRFSPKGSQMSDQEESLRRVQCPDCPDGQVWDSKGPTDDACLTCGGGAFIWTSELKPE